MGGVFQYTVHTFSVHTKLWTFDTWSLQVFSVPVCQGNHWMTLMSFVSLSDASTCRVDKIIVTYQFVTGVSCANGCQVVAFTDTSKSLSSFSCLLSWQAFWLFYITLEELACLYSYVTKMSIQHAKVPCFIIMANHWLKYHNKTTNNWRS